MSEELTAKLSFTSPDGEVEAAFRRADKALATLMKQWRVSVEAESLAN